MWMLLVRSLLLIRATPYLSGLSSRHNRAYANLNHLNVTTWLSVRPFARRASARRPPSARAC